VLGYYSLSLRLISVGIQDDKNPRKRIQEELVMNLNIVIRKSTSRDTSRSLRTQGKLPLKYRKPGTQDEHCHGSEYTKGFDSDQSIRSYMKNN